MERQASYWIDFECRVDGTARPGSAPSLFPLDQKRVWDRFEKGRTYDAWYDPVDRARYLLVEEPPGGFRRQLMLQLALSGGTAARALAVFLATRRKVTGRPGGPPGPAA